MAWFFRPRCPVDAKEKAGIESGIGRVVDRFGLRAFQNRKSILPTEDFFPLPYSAQPDEVRAIFESVTRHLALDGPHPEFQVFDDVADPDATEIVHRQSIRRGTLPVFYEYDFDEQVAAADRDVVIHIGASITQDLELLIAVLAGELCRFHNRRAFAVDDGEWSDILADLAAVGFGFGIFLANASLRKYSPTELMSHNWGISAPGTLQARHVGYALAVYTWIRNEQRTPWQRFLRLDAEAALKSGLRYLRKTGDALFDRETPGDYTHLAESQILADLEAGTPGRRIAAMWAVCDRTNIDAGRVVPAVTANLAHEDSLVRCEAAATLDQLGTVAESAVPALAKTIRDSSVRVRIASAYALGSVSTQDDAVVELSDTLGDVNLRVAHAAAWAVEQHGRHAERAALPLVKLLRRGLIDCEHEVIRQALAALNAVSDDPEGIIQKALGNRASDVRTQALDAWHDWRREQKSEAAQAST